MDRTLEQQLKRLQKLEDKILSQKENQMINNEVSSILQKVQTKIPSNVIHLLEKAFYKGFQLVFEKGDGIIEKTYNKEKLQLDHELYDYALDKKIHKRFIKKLDSQSSKTHAFNTSLSAIEGSVLGLFGIGIPDIPIFISIIIKTIYEIALSYGYTYDTIEEKAFILSLVRASMTKGEKQIEYNNLVDKLGEEIDQNIIIDINLEEEMKSTANLLSETLLTAKFIQGIPFIGAVGGIVNYTIIQKISRYSRLKYKKRYLLHKFKDSLDYEI